MTEINSPDAPKVLDAVVKAVDRQTKVLQEITKKLPDFYQYDLINDTALSDEYPDELDSEIEHYESLKKAETKSKGVH
tara:strand:+ start:310 stop:543 length:234 start_codon:yes stop_codon:yes gene_type:complete